MEKTEREQGRQRARAMAREVEQRSHAFLRALGFNNAEGMVADPRAFLEDIADWFAEQDANAQDPAEPMYVGGEDGLPLPNPRFAWRDPFSEERKQALMEGLGCIAALIYQRDVRGCGIGWVFCEQPGRHYGMVVLGPGIQVKPDGSLGVFYEDPWEAVRQNWQEILGDGGLRRFLGAMYPGGFGDSMNRAAQAIAQGHGDWVPPLFYITGAEYPDEA